MAASDILNIWNNAVSNLGAKTSIASLTEQSAEAAACALNYQTMIQRMIRETDWNCLRMTAALTDVSATFAPPARWAYRYSFPATCFMLRRLENPTGTLWQWNPLAQSSMLQGFEVAMDLDPGNSSRPTRYVYSNFGDLSAIFSAYVYDTANGYYEALFDASLVDAASWGLAADIAGALTGNAGIMQQAKAEAMRTLAEARAANATEGGPVSMDDFPAESLAIRGYGDWWPYTSRWGRW